MPSLGVCHNKPPSCKPLLSANTCSIGRMLREENCSCKLFLELKCSICESGKLLSCSSVHIFTSSKWSCFCSKTWYFTVLYYIARQWTNLPGLFIIYQPRMLCFCFFDWSDNSKSQNFEVIPGTGDEIFMTEFMPFKNHTSTKVFSREVVIHVTLLLMYLRINLFWGDFMKKKTVCNF